MNATELAAMIAQHFELVGYPFPGKPEIDDCGDYPLVLVWDDLAEVTRVIACCIDEAQIKDALRYAEQEAEIMAIAGEAPCGTVCHAAWMGGFVNGEE